MTSNPRRHTDEEPAQDRKRLWWLLSLCGFLLVPILIIWWPGCRQYPEVTSKESLQLLKSLYTACNTRDSARLARVEQGIAKAQREGKLTPRELDSFRSILDLAQNGNWERAEKASFKFAQDQVR